jgi:uncharacterized protein YqhQ
MMRGSRLLAVAVRAPHGNIVLHEEPVNAALYRGPISKIPFVRGLNMLWDALGLGMCSLMFSANVAVGDRAEFSLLAGLRGTHPNGALFHLGGIHGQRLLLGDGP